MKNIYHIVPDFDITNDFVNHLIASKIDYDIKRIRCLLFITCHCSNTEEEKMINKIFKLIRI